MLCDPFISAGQVHFKQFPPGNQTLVLLRSNVSSSLSESKQTDDYTQHQVSTTDDTL